MAQLPVVNPADFLPTPEAIEALSYEALTLQGRLKLKDLLAPLGIDYDVGVLETDPGPIVIQAESYVQLDTRARVNTAFRALRLAYAQGNDLVGLAADLGVKRRVLVPASGTTPAVLEDIDSLRYRSWLEMQRRSLGSSNLGLTGVAARFAMPDASDIRVYDFPGEGRIRCVLLPRPGLAPDGQAAMVARVSPGLMRRDVRPGSIIVDTALAEVLTLDLGVTLGVLPGASRASVAAASEAAIRSYMASRRQIGTRVAVSRLDRAAAVTNVVYAHFTGISADLVPSRDQAYQLGNLTVATELARD